MKELRPLRLAVAGLGFGADIHVPGLRRIPGVEVVALAGSTTERAYAVAETLGIDSAVGGYERLLDKKIDAVTLALPPIQSEVACEYFVSRGIPVLSEKPLASSATIARRLALLAKGLPCAVNFQFPELEAFQIAKRVLDQGQIGRVRSIHLTWMVESLAAKFNIKNWKTDAAQAGGVTALLLPHALYTVEWLHSPVASVFSHLRVKSHEGDIGDGRAPDTIQFCSTLRDGTLFGGFISNGSPGTHVHRWEIVGELASLLIENNSLDYMAGFSVRLLARGGMATTLFEFIHKSTVDGRLEPFISLATRFVECVRSGGTMKPSFQDGWHIQEAVEAMEISASTGAERLIDCCADG